MVPTVRYYQYGGGDGEELPLAAEQHPQGRGEGDYCSSSQSSSRWLSRRTRRLWTAAAVSALLAAAAVAYSSSSSYRQEDTTAQQHQEEEQLTVVANPDQAVSTVASFSTTNSHPFSPNKERWGDLSAPYPTGAWWLNFALDGAEECPAVAYPYAVRLQANSIHLSYSADREVVEEQTLSHVFSPDLAFSAAENPTSYSMDSFDQLSVTVKFETSGECSFKLFFVKGSPYTTIEYSKCSPVIRPVSTFSSVNGVTPVNWDAKELDEASSFTLELSNGQTWLLFVDRPVPLAATDSKLLWNNSQDGEPFSGVLRAAILKNSDDAQTLKEHAGPYPIGGDVSWKVNGDEMELVYQWKVKGGYEDDLLMLALPHHAEAMEGAVAEAKLAC